MKPDLTQFIALRNALHEERARLGARLAELNQALGADRGALAAPVAAPTPGRRTFSAATKAKMAAAQKARWAKHKGETAAPAAAPKQRRKISAQGRANIIAAVKARWAKVNTIKAKTAQK